MSRQKFTQAQIRELVKNPHVERCSATNIGFTKNFKVEVISQYHQGLSVFEIFRAAGFDLALIGKGTIKSCILRWRRIHARQGVNGLTTEARGRGRGGGRPKTRGITDADRIKRLEVENAYLKAENAFLAKLRALRRE